MESGVSLSLWTPQIKNDFKGLVATYYRFLKRNQSLIRNAEPYLSIDSANS